MTPPTTVRYSDAKSLLDLQRMLDRHPPETMRVSGEIVAPHRFMAYTANPMTVGTLVSSNASGVLGKADGSSKVGATGVVIGRGILPTWIWWSPDAVLWTKNIAAPKLTEMQEIYLARFGQMQSTKPTTSGFLVQKVGEVLQYDPKYAEYLVHIHPSVPMGIVLA